jgi:hypothetical protein
MNNNYVSIRETLDSLEISASLSVHNSGVCVHELTEMSVESVRGRTSDSSRSSRKPP